MMMSVQYYPVDQTKSLWVPDNARIVRPLKRNVLYPFFVYTSEDDKTSSAATADTWDKILL
jgi:hypothetical protein